MRQIHLGAFLYGFGHHQASWSHPSANPLSERDLGHYAMLAQTAERGLFDMVFLSDALAVRDWPREALSRYSRTAFFEPTTLLAALSAITRHVGLVATLSTSYNEPYNCARRMASIDMLSGGRAGWNVVTSTSDTEARNFSKQHQQAHDDRYKRAGEFVDVVNGLWGSWDADAFDVSPDEHRYFDPDRLHVLDHKGPYFDVRGPLNIARSPQGRPIIVQAGSSHSGKELAARTADVVFTAQSSLEPAQVFYADLKSRMSQYGRAPETLVVMPGILPVVGATTAEAEAKFEELQDLIHPSVGLAQLAELLGEVDLSGYPIDGPLPDMPETMGHKSRQHALAEMARRDGLTIRQLYKRVAAARGHLPLIGTAAQIADTMQTWFEQGAADGFNVMPPLMPRDLTDFVDHVVPELQRRGLYRTSYPGSTLRQSLALPDIAPALSRKNH
jgi:FMN-dependent oxidoreductase (nitrilotriacetate monooxygenase family)